MNISPSPKQHEAYQALSNTEVSEVFLGGGAGGGKSWLICESRLLDALVHPGCRSFIARNELKRLMQSTYITWLKVCAHHNIDERLWKLNGQYNYIEFINGSRIDLLDVKYLPSDPLYERFGSTEYTNGALEEAGEIHQLAKEVLKSRIGRHYVEDANSNLLCTGNPKKNWTYSQYYKPWKNGTLSNGIIFIQSLWKDNPNLPKNYGEQLAQIQDKVMKERLLYGNWEYEDDPSALIEFDAINDLWTNVVDTGNKYIVADIARFGKDTTRISVWNGLRCLYVKKLVKSSIDTTIREINNISVIEKIPRSRILVDEDGVGGGVVDGLKGSKGFMGASKPISMSRDIYGKPGQTENYINLKSQCGYLLSMLINERKVACNNLGVEDNTLLIEELEQIKRKNIDGEGKLALISKEDIKEHIGRSPDLSDVFLMRMYFELSLESVQVVNYEFRDNIKELW